MKRIIEILLFRKMWVVYTYDSYGLDAYTTFVSPHIFIRLPWKNKYGWDKYWMLQFPRLWVEQFVRHSQFNGRVSYLQGWYLIAFKKVFLNKCYKRCELRYEPLRWFETDSENKI